LRPSDAEEKIGVQWTVHELILNLKKAYDSVRREALYGILAEFGIAMKLVGLIKTRLNE
jgi:hypothetical protein